MAWPDAQVDHPLDRLVAQADDSFGYLEFSSRLQLHLFLYPQKTLAFSTIQGTGGAPDLFVGTSGVDSITITNLDDAVDLRAFDSDDNITVANDAGVVDMYTLLGGSGNDIFTSNTTTLADASRINGNEGNDRITLGAFGAVSQTSSTVVGGKGNDTIVLTGSINSSLVNGNLDDDTITTAGASNSSVFGGQGVDTINIVGTDVNATVLTVVNGDKGGDFINVAGSVNQSTINGGDGDDAINLLAGITSFTDSSVFGGDGIDTINGAAVGAFALTLSGDAGNDVINGGGGADSLYGGAGNDQLLGNGGADSITGGVGADRLTGGAGNDRFAFAIGDSFTATGIANNTATFQRGTTTSVDVILDFSAVAATGAGDSVQYAELAGNSTQNNGLGANAVLNVNGTATIANNLNGQTLNAGINRVYFTGNWNQTTGVFTYNGGAYVAGATDIMVAQVNLAGPVAASTAALGTVGINSDITNQFLASEAIILENVTFT